MTDKQKYDKPALTLEEQAFRLLQRGLQGISHECLTKKLSSISYYRLRGYTYPYQDNNKPDTPFKNNTMWDDIEHDYYFDRNLRITLFEAIEHFEVAFRTQLILHMSLHHDSRWYSDKTLFYNKEAWKKDYEELKKDWKRSRESFTEHYNRHYDNTYDPPSWMIFETTTLGTVSKYYKNLNSSLETKNAIASFWGFTKSSIKILESWLQHIVLVRNICAHHGRLFSKPLIIKPIIPKDKKLRINCTLNKQDRIYVTICILTHLLDICAPDYSFRDKIISLMSIAETRQLTSMGFPPKWENETIFQK